MPNCMPKRTKNAKRRSKSRNEADALAFRATKALNEYRDKLPKDVVDDVQSKIDAVKKAIESNDIGRIKHSQSMNSKPTCSTSAKPWHKAAGGEGGPSGMGGGAHAAEEPASHRTTSESTAKPRSGDDEIEEADVEIIDPK